MQLTLSSKNFVDPKRYSFHLAIVFICFLDNAFSLIKKPETNTQHPRLLPSLLVNHDKQASFQETNCFIGKLCEYKIPETAFSCEIKRIVISRAGESDLPEWLLFKKDERILTGVPFVKDEETLEILIVGLTDVPNSARNYICGSSGLKITIWTLKYLPLFTENSLPEIKTSRTVVDRTNNVCGKSTPIIFASFMFTINFHDLNGEERHKLFTTLTSVYNVNTQDAFLLPNTTSTTKRQNPFSELLDSPYVVASGSAASSNSSTVKYGILLTWYVKCGVIHTNHSLFEDIQRLSVKWFMLKNVNISVNRWFIVTGFQRHGVIRRRRNVVGGTTTPVYASTVSSPATVVTTRIKSKQSPSLTIILTRSFLLPTITPSFQSSNLSSLSTTLPSNLTFLLSPTPSSLIVSTRYQRSSAISSPLQSSTSLLSSSTVLSVITSFVYSTLMSSVILTPSQILPTISPSFIRISSLPSSNVSLSSQHGLDNLSTTQNVSQRLLTQSPVQLSSTLTLASQITTAPTQSSTTSYSHISFRTGSSSGSYMTSTAKTNTEAVFWSTRSLRTKGNETMITSSAIPAYTTTFPRTSVDQLTSAVRMSSIVAEKSSRTTPQVTFQRSTSLSSQSTGVASTFIKPPITSLTPSRPLLNTVQSSATQQPVTTTGALFTRQHLTSGQFSPTVLLSPSRKPIITGPFTAQLPSTTQALTKTPVPSDTVSSFITRETSNTKPPLSTQRLRTTQSNATTRHISTTRLQSSFSQPSVYEKSYSTQTPSTSAPTVQQTPTTRLPSNTNRTSKFFLSTETRSIIEHYSTSQLIPIHSSLWRVLSTEKPSTIGPLSTTYISSTMKQYFTTHKYSMLTPIFTTGHRFATDSLLTTSGERSSTELNTITELTTIHPATSELATPISTKTKSLYFSSLKPSYFVSPLTSNLFTTLLTSPTVKLTNDSATLISSTPILTNTGLFSVATKDFVTSSSQFISSTSSIKRPTVLPNRAPKVYNSFDLLSVSFGEIFHVQVPIDTFHDREDGNTRNLILKCIDKDHKPLPSNSWLQFNSTAQMFYGIILNSQVTQAEISSEYLLVAIDSVGNQVYDAFIVDVQEDNEIPAVEYKLRVIGTDIEKFSEDLSKILLLVQKVANHYADKDTSSISVKSVEDGSVWFTWSNNTIKTCDLMLIKELTSKIITATGSIQPAFQAILLPEFYVENVYENKTGPCVSTTAQPVTEALLSSQDNKLWLKYFIPGLVIAIIIIIIALVCFVVRRHTGVKVLKADKQTFKRRKPVILDEEREMSTLSGKPVQLPDDSLMMPIHFPTESSIEGDLDNEDYPQWFSPKQSTPIYEKLPPKYEIPRDATGYNNRTPPPPYKLPPSY